MRFHSLNLDLAAHGLKMKRQEKGASGSAPSYDGTGWLGHGVCYRHSNAGLTNNMARREVSVWACEV